MVEWDRDSFILARGFALRKRKCDFICAISGQLKRKRHLVSNFTADHSARFFCRRLGRIPSWPLAKKRSGIPLSRACSFLPRSKDRGTGFLLYGATHDLAVKIHVSYEAVQHAKKHGLTDNRVSENRSGTNDLLSTRATKFSKRYTGFRRNARFWCKCNPFCAVSMTQIMMGSSLAFRNSCWPREDVGRGETLGYFVDCARLLAASPLQFSGLYLLTTH